MQLTVLQYLKLIVFIFALDITIKMTITQLKYVLAVAEHKNFTLAAEKCFVTQPTLSIQKKIEEELSIQIFDRTKTNSIN
jgi:LysR family hydrogen peroxide-inducible transcriptional activator